MSAMWCTVHWPMEAPRCSSSRPQPTPTLVATGRLLLRISSPTSMELPQPSGSSSGLRIKQGALFSKTALQIWRRVGEVARPLLLAGAWLSGGAAQPGGLAMVPPGGRWRPVRPGRHLVADRDWRSGNRSQTFISWSTFAPWKATATHVWDEPCHPRL